jgi:organic radical activating enzyme
MEYTRIGKYITHTEGLQMSMIATRFCFRNCSYCVEHAAKNVETTTVNVDRLLRATEKVLAWRPQVTDIVVTGGEPLIITNLHDLLKGLKEQGLNVYLNTSTLIGAISLESVLDVVDKISLSIHDISDAFLSDVGVISAKVPIRASVLTSGGAYTAKFTIDRLIDADCVDSMLLRNMTFNSAALIETKLLIPDWLPSPYAFRVYNGFEVYYDFVYRDRCISLKHAQNDKMREQMQQIKDLVIEPIVNHDGSIGRWWDDSTFDP